MTANYESNEEKVRRNQTIELSSACLQSISGAFFEVGALKLLSMRGLGARHGKEIPESRNCSFRLRKSDTRIPAREFPPILWVILLISYRRCKTFRRLKKSCYCSSRSRLSTRWYSNPFVRGYERISISYALTINVRYVCIQCGHQTILKRNARSCVTRTLRRVVFLENILERQLLILKSLNFDDSYWKLL